MRFLSTLMLCSLIGCYASHELALEGERDVAFADDWVVLSAFGWAEIATETVYRFHEDGEIEIVRHSEGTYFEGEAGQWFFYGDTTEDAPTCAFGDHWWSTDGQLHVESECTDGVTRALVLEEAGGSNAGGEPKSWSASRRRSTVTGTCISG